jgi:hypothetical protein
MRDLEDEVTPAIANVLVAVLATVGDTGQQRSDMAKRSSEKATTTCLLTTYVPNAELVINPRFIRALSSGQTDPHDEYHGCAGR